MNSRAAVVALACLSVSPAPSIPGAPLRVLEPRHVMVTASDYAFVAPDTLPAGPTSFRLRNTGRMHHELVVFAARPGVSWAQMRAAATLEDRRALADPPVGVIFTPVSHRESAELVTTLNSGQWYMLFCGIRDSAGMPPHFMIGMIDSIYVR